MQSWSIIMFFYNEEGNVSNVCQKIISFLNPLPNDKKEVIFINDGSTDQSLENVKKIMEDYSYIKFINHKKNLGVGSALRSGYNQATMENICAVPGDGQFDLNELKAFRNIPEKTIISFFRVSRPNYSTFRKILTKLNRIINKLLFSFYLKDVNWIKIYKKSSLKGLSLKSSSLFLESEIIYLLNKTHRIIETPCFFLPRQYGSSKVIKLKVFIRIWKDIIYLFSSRFFIR